MWGRYLLNANSRPSLRVEDFEGKFTDTATNTPVAVVHEKVNALVRVVVVSGIKVAVNGMASPRNLSGRNTVAEIL